MGDVKEYTPQAGDVCEWTYLGYIREVIICSPEKTQDGNYIALDQYDLEYLNHNHWYCHINDLKLIYRP